MLPDFYNIDDASARLPASPNLGTTFRLGLEEGQVRLTCGPGQTKVYLQEFPWEKCVPDEELEAPAPFEMAPSEDVPPPMEPEPVPVPAPEQPPPREPEPPKVLEPEPITPPGKARFLDVDPQTGDILDPDTGAVIRPHTVLALTPVDTGITVAAGLLVTGVVLVALGVFGGK